MRRRRIRRQADQAVQRQVESRQPQRDAPLRRRRQPLRVDQRAQMVVDEAAFVAALPGAVAQRHLQRCQRAQARRWPRSTRPRPGRQVQPTASRGQRHTASAPSVAQTMKAPCSTSTTSARIDQPIAPLSNHRSPNEAPRRRTQPGPGHAVGRPAVRRRRRCHGAARLGRQHCRRDSGGPGAARSVGHGREPPCRGVAPAARTAQPAVAALGLPRLRRDGGRPLRDSAGTAVRRAPVEPRTSPDTPRRRAGCSGR